MWGTFFKRHWPECKLQEPAADATIEKGESELSVILPRPLLALLRETDGVFGPDGEYLIFPIEDLVEINVDLWLNHDYEGMYMPFESLLFFGSDEADNLFAYPILGDNPDKSKIFRWRRDTDSRMFYANGLEQYFYMQWKCYQEGNPMLWDQSKTCKDFEDYKTFLRNLSESESNFAPDDAFPGTMSG